MPKGIRGTRDFYKERFALGERLAVRLAALLAHKVDASAAAIEELRDSPALQHIFLHPRLLDIAEELTTENLLELALPGEEPPPLVVTVDEEGWRTVALAEEIVAEEGVGDSRGEENLPAITERHEVLHPDEIAELFTRRDIAELELTLRTSAEPKERITALRRLALSPASKREKLALFAMALLDRDALVRSEAAQALTVLGLAPEVAEDARALAEGNERQRRAAAQRVGSRFQGATDAEIGVLLRIVAGTLRYESSLEVRRLLIRAVEGACRAVAGRTNTTRELARMLLGQLRDAAEELGPEVRRVLALLGKFNPDDLHAYLQEELATTTDRSLRRLVVAAAGEVVRTKEQERQLCRQALAEIAASDDPSVECLQLVNLLGRLGEVAVDEAAERVLEVPEAAQECLVRVLDAVATRSGASAAIKAKVGRIFLSVLRRGQRSARLAVVHSLATVDPAVPPRTRRALAAELLACLQEYANPGIVSAIEATVGKLGAPAVEPLLEVLGAGQRPAPRVSAARVLGALVPRLEASEREVARKAITTSLEVLAGEFPDRGTLARMVGQMCAGPAPDEATVAAVVEALRGYVLDKEVSNAALDGLGRVALSPRAAPALRVELVSFFGRLLERELPEIEATTESRDDELVYTLGGEVTAYTELVPGLIAGIQNVATTASGVLRHRALGHLLSLWRKVASGQEQLGPGNTELLLNALRAIGTLPDTEPSDRQAVVEALCLRKDYLPTYSALVEVVVGAGKGMSETARNLAEEMLQREATDNQLTDSERLLLLRALVVLATRGKLGRGARRLRERVVGAALDAEARDVEGAQELLAEVANSPGIAARLRERVAARLGSSGRAEGQRAARP